VTNDFQDPDKMLILHGDVYRDLVEIAGFDVNYNISVASVFVDPLDL